MAWRSYKRDMDKIHVKIDKMAKKGRDNFQEYYNYVDSMLLKKQYGLLTQVLMIKYNFNWENYQSVFQVKQKSWLAILFITNPKTQEDKYSLMRTKSIYQIGLTYYKQLPQTTVSVVDSSGSGAMLIPNIENGAVMSIDIARPGQNYSTASTISIVGGVMPATASIPLPNGVRGGKILDVIITASGSSHNQDINLGTITEVDFYIAPYEGLSQKEYQEVIGNKQTYLSVLKSGTTSVATFSTWATQSSYNRNVLNLYVEAFNYLV